MVILPSNYKEKTRDTIIKLLCCLGVKVEVFEEFRCPVLLVPLAITSLPPQMTPRILQLQEAHSLQEQHTHRYGVNDNRRGQEMCLLAIQAVDFTD